MAKNIPHLQVLSTFTDKLDIIGDIHGCYFTLLDLLRKLGYQEIDGIWQHPGRLAVFIGDYIDRGLYTHQVLKLIKKMVENHKAIALLGNHEYNFVAINTYAPDGQPYRSLKKLKQHQATLKSIPQPQINFWVEWFKTLPFFIELEKIRIVHAAWDNGYVKFLSDHYPTLSLRDRMPQSLSRHSADFVAINYLLKGPELKNVEQLPIDSRYKEFSGLRIKWWEKFDHKPTLNDILVDPMPDIPAPEEFYSLYKPYPPDEKILFFGHYTLPGSPEILQKNLTCVDYSAYKKNKLVAYRYNGEPELNNSNFVWVEYNPGDVIL